MNEIKTDKSLFFRGKRGQHIRDTPPRYQSQISNNTIVGRLNVDVLEKIPYIAEKLKNVRVQQLPQFMDADEKQLLDAKIAVIKNWIEHEAENGEVVINIADLGRLQQVIGYYEEKIEELHQSHPRDLSATQQFIDKTKPGEKLIAISGLSFLASGIGLIIAAETSDLDPEAMLNWLFISVGAAIASFIVQCLIEVAVMSPLAGKLLAEKLEPKLNEVSGEIAVLEQSLAVLQTREEDRRAQHQSSLTEGQKVERAGPMNRKM